jgi:hypothetical protein
MHINSSKQTEKSTRSCETKDLCNLSMFSILCTGIGKITYTHLQKITYFGSVQVMPWIMGNSLGDHNIGSQ